VPAPWQQSADHRSCLEWVQDVTKTSDEDLKSAATQGGAHLCRQDLVQAKQGIGELFGRVADIKRKAEASEAMVQVSGGQNIAA
jgi:hypothetical protein